MSFTSILLNIATLLYVSPSLEAALTAILFDRNNDKIVDISTNSFQTTNRLQIRNRSTGLTYAPEFGKFYAISGDNKGKQELVELCGSSKLPIASISPSEVLLTCLTGGPNGVFAIDNSSLEFGKVKVKTGEWQPVGPIPSPFGQFVFAQDSSGELHYINGNGEYFTSPSKQDFTLVTSGNNFPTDLQGFCGDFSDTDTIVSGNLIDAGIIEYSISDRSSQLQTLDQNIGVQDVSVGPLSNSCPTEIVTAVSFSPKERVVDINVETSTKDQLVELDENLGITHDLASGNFYAIKGFSTGEQEIVQVCGNKVTPISSIGPSQVRLSCLTSGPSGFYSIDLETGDFGKVNINSGNFKSIDTLPRPYDGYAFAQDQTEDGKLHYINGAGEYYIKRRQTLKLQDDLTFPTTNSLGICGEFDGSDIITAANDVDGGIVRYSLLKGVTSVEATKKKKIFYNDVTTGPFSSEECSSSNDITAVSDEKVVDLNLISSKITNVRSLSEASLGISYDSSTETFYGLSGEKEGAQSLVQVCSDTIIPIAAISPSSIQLDCLSAGPSGLFALDINSGRFGRINTNNGKWNKVGNLPGTIETTYVFAQDNTGMLHFINDEGKYFTNEAKSSKLQHVDGQFFFPLNSAKCGDFDGSDIVAASSESSGTIRYNFALQSSTLQKMSPNALLNDVTTVTLDKKCLTTKNPTSRPTANNRPTPAPNNNNRPTPNPLRRPTPFPFNTGKGGGKSAKGKKDSKKSASKSSKGYYHSKKSKKESKKYYFSSK